MATKTEKKVQLVINKMTKAVYDQLSSQGQISEDQLYLLDDDASGGGGSWGSITGDLSAQTDLKDALDDKADQSYVDDTFTDITRWDVTVLSGSAVGGGAVKINLMTSPSPSHPLKYSPVELSVLGFDNVTHVVYALTKED